MNSISQFKKILTVEKLNLFFKVDFYKNITVRDMFVDMLTHPVTFFFNKTEKQHILKNIDLTLKEGDRLGILGVNGAGKSTLCRCIAGLIQPDTGVIRTEGEMRAIFDANVGIVPELTGRENALLMSHFLYPNLSKTERSELIEESLEFSELGDYLDTPFQKYSKGMQTRLSLSLISAKPCDLLILDEVFDGADMFFQEKVAVRVTDLILKSGAVIFVSHQPDQILKLCNRLIILNKSQMIYDGEVEKGMSIYRNLKN
jgi:ABC-type polysaccharide/polyol phosphate transport system ATPase subunit